MEDLSQSHAFDVERLSGLAALAALREEVRRLQGELEALRLDGSWATAQEVDELLGTELVHEYNTRSA